MFITLEGGEGAGKTTQAQHLQTFLTQQGIDCLLTREPGGTTVGEALREVLLQNTMHSETELLLLFTARMEHIQQVILPALKQEKWVICDRFTDASYAYQGGGRGVPMQRIQDLETWALGELRPNLTLLFDIPVEAGLNRARGRSALDRFEQENRDFLERVRQTYLQRATQYPQRYTVLDASQTESQLKYILEQIMQSLITKD
jgi:dTMP kinase